MARGSERRSSGVRGPAHAARRVALLRIGIAALLTAALAAAFVGCGDPAPSRPRPGASDGSVGAARFAEEVYPIFERKCLDCHHSEVSPPWYAVLPLIGPTVRRDIEWGRQRLDLALPYPFTEGDEVGPAGHLYGLRSATLEDSMPPLLYRFTHPRSPLTDEERRTIVDWAEAAIAETAERNAREARDLPGRAADLLRNRCSRCHRGAVDDEMNGGFDYAWDVEYLSEDEDYVVAEDSEGSPLFERLIDDRDPMPPSPHDRLTEDEVELVRLWIDEGAAAP